MVRHTNPDDVRTDVLTAAADALESFTGDATQSARGDASAAYDRAFGAAMDTLREVDLSDRPDGLVSEVDELVGAVRNQSREATVEDLREAVTADAEGDQVVIRTDDGVIKATVDEVIESDRPEDGARMGGVLEADDPPIHYVDYWHNDDGDRFAYDGEDHDIEAEARAVLGDTHVDDVLSSHDARYDAIAELADAVVDEEDDAGIWADANEADRRLLGDE